MSGCKFKEIEGVKIVIKDLIKKNRSVRGYDNSRDVTYVPKRKLDDVIITR